MEAADVIGAVSIGVAGGMLAGLVGVGGGVLFVPGLVVFLGLAQIDAGATSLVAVVLVGGVGAWRQRSYGNLRLRDGVALALFSPVGVVAGVLVAHAVGERALELSFAGVQLVMAAQLVRRIASADRPSEASSG
ncbi:MAG: TSUP family transporter [Thermoleophilaceae bacterium]